jgi:hypothetical protein
MKLLPSRGFRSEQERQYHIYDDSKKLRIDEISFFHENATVCTYTVLRIDRSRIAMR